MLHSETRAIGEALEGSVADPDDQVLTGAQVYLTDGGPAQFGELTRVLRQHLDLPEQVVAAAIRRLVGAGRLTELGYLVSLPAGNNTRDDKENRS